MKIPEKYRGEAYVKVATDFTIPIDSVYATAFGYKPRYACRVFLDLEDMQKSYTNWLDGIKQHLHGDVVASFDKVNHRLGNLVKRAVTELNRGKLDINQLERYILEQCRD